MNLQKGWDFKVDLYDILPLFSMSYHPNKWMLRETKPPILRDADSNLSVLVAFPAPVLEPLGLINCLNITAAIVEEQSHGQPEQNSK
eukprot:617415-Ditylum_brightwellii.AAC.1